MKVTADFFKRSGKWYMTETFEVPSVNVYDLREWIESNRPYKDEFIMVINEEASTDIIGFPMMDFPK